MAPRVPPEDATISAPQNSGYWTTEKARPAGATERMVRIQRSSCDQSARSDVSATVVRGKVGASSTSKPSARMRCPRTLSSARELATAPNPPILSSVARRSIMVLPRQSRRPSARANPSRIGRSQCAAPKDKPFHAHFGRSCKRARKLLNGYWSSCGNG
jgi:hypothetical protein